MSSAPRLHEEGGQHREPQVGVSRSRMGRPHFLAGKGSPLLPFFSRGQPSHPLSPGVCAGAVMWKTWRPGPRQPGPSLGAR